MLLVLVIACTPAPDSLGVYKSGPNAIVRGAREGTLQVWGAEGTLSRIPSPGPDGTSLLGEAGPLWIVTRDVPAPPKATPVQAALIESFGYQLKGVVGAQGTNLVDPAQSGGVWVRSAIKVRRHLAPPVYLVGAARDDLGVGKVGGPEDTRTGDGCTAVVAVLDAQGANVLASAPVPDATAICAAPGVLGPVDRDGDGGTDFMVYGSHGAKAFRAWFELTEQNGLVAGPTDRWEGIP